MSEPLLGPFTEEYRKEFLDQKALDYLFKHPDERPSFARRMARQYWRRHVQRALNNMSKEAL